MLGRRKRVLLAGDGVKSYLLIRRLRCENASCNRIHHELPDCIVPYKRYGAEVIEKIISGDSKELQCSEETLKRILWWWGVMLGYFLGILAGLSEKHQISWGPAPSLKEMVRATVNTNRWTFPGKILTRSCPVSGGRGW